MSPRNQPPRPFYLTPSNTIKGKKISIFLHTIILISIFAIIYGWISHQQHWLVNGIIGMMISGGASWLTHRYIKAQNRLIRNENQLFKEHIKKVVTKTIKG